MTEQHQHHCVPPIAAGEIARRERTVVAWERVANALERIANGFDELIDEVVSATTPIERPASSDGRGEEFPPCATTHALDDRAQHGNSWESGRGGRPLAPPHETKVMKRDGNLCQPCKRAGRLSEAKEVDHIVGIAEGGNDHPDNLQAICIRCHIAKTNGIAEGEQPKRPNKPPRLRMLPNRVQSIR